MLDPVPHFFEVCYVLSIGKVKKSLEQVEVTACAQIRTATSHSRFLLTINMSNERPSKNNRINKLSQTFKSKISSLLRPSRSSASSLIDPGSSSDHHQTVATTDGDQETRQVITEPCHNIFLYFIMHF